MKKGTKEINNYKLQEIYMRDPFILSDMNSKKYYLYGTTAGVCDGCANIDPHFETYVSDDLINFEGPYIAFEPEKGFWGVKNYWAPETYFYNDKYYMFATFKGGIKEDRGTGILVSDTPYGPFKQHSEGHVTLKNNECLDGTLYIDTNNQPYIVFCHEWTQIYYGKILALKLTKDLKSVIDEEYITIVDTKIDHLPWIRKMFDPRVNKTGYLTDAPCMYTGRDGSLYMLWSSYSIKGFTKDGFGGYTVAAAKSLSGKIDGPFAHADRLLLDANIGHVSLFRDFNNKLYMVGHANDTLHGSEYPIILSLTENGSFFTLVKYAN